MQDGQIWLHSPKLWPVPIRQWYKHQQSTSIMFSYTNIISPYSSISRHSMVHKSLHIILWVLLAVRFTLLTYRWSQFFLFFFIGDGVLNIYITVDCSYDIRVLSAEWIILCITAHLLVHCYTAYCNSVYTCICKIDRYVYIFLNFDLYQ